MLLEQEYYILFYIISFTTIMSLITFLVGCVCCRKKVQQNDMLGLEGLVKLKNPDDNITSTSSILSVEPKSSSGNLQQEMDIRRASNAPHRSLPDIPISDPHGDTNSELYATVGDKVLEKPQGRSPIVNLKKQTSVSQHSSLSQADDISSPYARVRSPHSYDKVRHTEHPYAQLNQSGSNNIAHSKIDEVATTSNSPSRRDSNESLLGLNEESSKIPAGSAIAGHVAASQELPYMTPPILPAAQQNFSGDSQDSSKGYTSISVREPLANIIAQTNSNLHKKRDIKDSHYATVSDDSDEMYAAIDDPNNVAELYTSGSETYAQIQPQSTSITVSVEINATPRHSHEIPSGSIRRLSNNVSQLPTQINKTDEASESLRAQMHSRQASSSSCSSSVGNLGSPKPEKRQANSPLPPPPTTVVPLQSNNSSTSNLTSSSTNISGRNSVASIIEVTGLNSVTKDNESKINSKKSGNIEDSKKKQSPSKDLEGMYAKVMKKNKLSHLPSQNSSPNLPRKQEVSQEMFLSDPDISRETNLSSGVENKKIVKSASNTMEDNYETIDKHRDRLYSYDSKDPGYETIPGESGSNAANSSFGIAKGIQRVSHSTIAVFNELEKISNEPGYESLPDDINRIKKEGNIDGDYELVSNITTKKTTPTTAIKPHRTLVQRTSSDYDPNYEVLRPVNHGKSISDDGYAKILEKKNIHDKTFDNDLSDGYSSIKSINKNQDNSSSGGYSTIKENDHSTKLRNHDYASIKESKSTNVVNNNEDDGHSDMYFSIPNPQTPDYLHIKDSSLDNYSTIPETNYTGNQMNSISPITNKNSINSPGYSSISETRTTPSTDSFSSDTNMSYQAISNNTNNNSLSLNQNQSNSNYESCTGSESDPNYESVRYVNVTENPYERLHNEKGSENLATNQNLLLPSTSTIPSIVSNNVNQLVIKTETVNDSNPKKSDSGEVGDFFQV